MALLTDVAHTIGIMQKNLRRCPFLLLFALLGAVYLSGTMAVADPQVGIEYHSDNGRKVLQPTITTIAQNRDNTVVDIHITNGQNAFYYVTVQPESARGNLGAPRFFILTPNGRTLSHVQFYGGDSLALSADGTYSSYHPELAVVEALHLASIIALDDDKLVPSACEGNLDASDAFLLLLGQFASVKTHAFLFVEDVGHFDYPGAAGELREIAEDPNIARLLTNLYIQKYKITDPKKLAAVLKNYDDALGAFAFISKFSKLAPHLFGSIFAAYHDAAYDNLTFDATQYAQPVPLYRYYNYLGRGDRFYTTNFSELGHGGSGGWVYDGPQCGVYPVKISGTVPLYRYINRSLGLHFFTVENHDLRNIGYEQEGIACYVYKAGAYPNSSVVPLYRYYNPHSQAHFYTTNFGELGNGNSQWHSEGVECNVLR